MSLFRVFAKFAQGLTTRERYLSRPGLAGIWIAKERAIASRDLPKENFMAKVLGIDLGDDQLLEVLSWRAATR